MSNVRLAGTLPPCSILVIARHCCGPHGGNVCGRGRASEQVRHKRHRDISAGWLSVEPSSKRTHARRTQRCREETTSGGCFRFKRSPERSTPCESRCIGRVQLRRTQALFANEFVRRSEVLPGKLSWRPDGWRQRWNSVRGTIVRSLASRRRIRGECQGPANSVAHARRCRGWRLQVGLTRPSSGRAPAGFARCVPPLM
jgi:hypothetical protein